MGMTKEEIEKMLKATYLEVANMDLETKYLRDTQSMACSKFRVVMLEKLSKAESEGTEWMTKPYIGMMQYI